MPQRSIAVGRAFSLTTKTCGLLPSLKLQRRQVPRHPALHHLLRVPGQPGTTIWGLQFARRDLPGQMIVIENPMDSKCAIAKLLHDARNLACAFDPQLFRAVIRGGNQYLDPNLRTNRWTCIAYDQSSIQRDIARKTSAHAFSTVIPMEDDGQLQLVADCHSTLYPAFEDWAEAHK